MQKNKVFKKISILTLSFVFAFISFYTDVPVADSATCIINSFTADTTTPSYNTSTTLRISLSGAYAWSVTLLSGTVNPMPPTSGTSMSANVDTGNLTSNHTYRLTCGSQIQDVTVVPGAYVPKVIATIIVCDSESDMPNWDHSPVNVTSTTASNFIATHPNCHTEPNWYFQASPATLGGSCQVWGTSDLPDGKDTGTITAPAGYCPWITFGPTNNSGVATFDLTTALSNGNDSVWVREALKENYLPFSIPPLTGTDYSAEMWCHTDLTTYDNGDAIQGLQPATDYYCIGFNVLDPASLLFSVNVTKTGNGTVKSGDALIDCGSTCSRTYGQNTTVTLTAIPSSKSWKFTGWGGACVGTGTCVLVVNSQKNVTATFQAVQPGIYIEN